ncbi:hypothetical protein KIPB_004822 [Kipferlia bialata]|uniref:Zinc finger protein n=1 Tax=Kipferlia bialata TaxID=797122 RepID=A0A9K3GIG7_9EUKA|nr:hypothetical protein KIPB_004822 [Kipferlia bialata]|eukprot:g4822.t1
MTLMISICLSLISSVLREFVFAIGNDTDEFGHIVDKDHCKESDMLPICAFEEYEDHKHFRYIMDDKMGRMFRYHENKRRQAKHNAKVRAEALAAAEREREERTAEVSAAVIQREETFRLSADQIISDCLEFDRKTKEAAEKRAAAGLEPEEQPMRVIPISGRLPVVLTNVMATYVQWRVMHADVSEEAKPIVEAFHATMQTVVGIAFPEDTEAQTEEEKARTETLSKSSLGEVCNLLRTMPSRERMVAAQQAAEAMQRARIAAGLDPENLEDMLHALEEEEEGTTETEATEGTDTTYDVDMEIGNTEEELTGMEAELMEALVAAEGDVLADVEAEADAEAEAEAEAAADADMERERERERDGEEETEAEAAEGEGEKEKEEEKEKEKEEENYDDIPADCVYLRVLPDPVRRRGCPHYIRRRGCPHYIRKCEAQCSVCGEWYMCRRCHDAEIVDHAMPRFEIQRIRCLECGHESGIMDHCEKCGTVYADHYCGPCRLFDSTGPDTKPTVHCDQCGVCRVALDGMLKHCDECNTCYFSQYFDSHRCAKPTKDCPICADPLMHSVFATIVLPCGHCVHHKCLVKCEENHMYTCPLCNKLVLEGKDKQSWEDWMAQRRAAYVIPEHLQTPVEVHCRECENTWTDKRHFVCYKCPECGTHNTSQ